MAEAFWETWSHLEFIYTDGHFKMGGGEEEDNWDTDTEMCDDLAWCLDYIELSNKWYLYNCI